MEIEIGENIIILEDEIKMKHLKVLYPIFKKIETGELSEILIIENVISTLFVSLNWENDKAKLSEFIDNLWMDWINILSENVGKIMNQIQGKKK